MSYRLKEDLTVTGTASDDGTSSDDNESLEDWASSLGEALNTKSLFCDKVFPTPQAALKYDEEEYGIRIQGEADRLGVDLYGRMRLINWIRSSRPTPEQVRAVGRERLEDDSLLIPAIPDDPLLQYDYDDMWSEDEVPNEPHDKVKMLEQELAKALASVKKLQGLVQELTSEPETSGQSIKPRDDDTHYFGSYEENDIHEIMLRDTTRTVSYARFILSNPQIFQGATVMDVGCGTAILSMLAAKAGARRVYAVEASGLALKARSNVEKNGLQDVITVIQGKVEQVQIDDKVDVIISEWMGYMLLYESMLDSVLNARDRFLVPGGLVVPSQTRLVINAITAGRIWQERIEFWKSIYGFDMSVMDAVYYDDGIVEVVDEIELVTNDCVIKDVNAHEATIKSLDFTSPFSLKTSVRSSVPPESMVDTSIIGDDVKTPVVPLPMKEMGNTISFTTGPKGKPTHWKQVVFLLREPITASPGDSIEGVFHCRKSKTNSRELDVEIHYGLKREGCSSDEVKVQIYRVK